MHMEVKNSPLIKNIKDITPKKEFRYEKDEITLSFTLRVDNSSELRSFKSLLEEAIKDINSIVKGMKN